MHLFSNPDKMILNPYRFAAAGGGPAFGLASRSFDGSTNKITTSTVSHGIGTGDFTWCVWVKPASLSPQLRAIGQNGAFTPAWYTNGLNASGAEFGIYWSGYLDSGQTLTLNTWQHLVFMRESGTLKFFVDGSQTSDTHSVSTGMSNAAHTIGDEGGSPNYHGLMCDYRIYSRALSPTEISTIIAGGDVETSLVAWWLKNSDDVLDHAGSADGTNSGTTYSTDGPLD